MMADGPMASLDVAFTYGEQGESIRMDLRATEPGRTFKIGGHMAEFGEPTSRAQFFALTSCGQMGRQKGLPYLQGCLRMKTGQAPGGAGGNFLEAGMAMLAEFKTFRFTLMSGVDADDVLHRSEGGASCSTVNLKRTEADI